MEKAQQRHLAVDEPIINSPFKEPESYWVYDTATGQPVKLLEGGQLIITSAAGWMPGKPVSLQKKK